MKQMKWFLALLILVCAGAFAGGVMAKDVSNALQCQLHVPTSVKLGEAVTLKFELKNNSADDLMLLKWNTPLEGWFGSSFNVTRGGKWVNYQGAMVKRFRPSSDDYVAIPAGKSISNTVNLAEGYQINQAGEYQFVFNGRLQDVQAVASSDEISKKRKLQSLKCETFKVLITP